MQMLDNTTVASPPKRTIIRRIFKIVVWLLPLVIAVGVAIFFYLQWQKTAQLAEQDKQATADSNSEKEIIREEIDQLVAEVGAIVALPEGEIPTLVTIKDINEITDNKDFFSGAQNGDKVLVYQQAKKAYLYRPSSKKLINLAPISIDQATDNKNDSAVKSESDTVDEEPLNATIVLRNGTVTTGLTLQFQNKLLEKFEQLEVIARENAARDDYATSVVATINDQHSETAQEISKTMNIPRGELPEGEQPAAADVIIILGQDQTAL